MLTHWGRRFGTGETALWIAALSLPKADFPERRRVDFLGARPRPAFLRSCPDLSGFLDRPSHRAKGADAFLNCRVGDQEVRQIGHESARKNLGRPSLNIAVTFPRAHNFPTLRAVLALLTVSFVGRPRGKYLARRYSASVLVQRSARNRDVRNYDGPRRLIFVLVGGRRRLAVAAGVLNRQLVASLAGLRIDPSAALPLLGRSFGVYVVVCPRTRSLILLTFFCRALSALALPINLTSRRFTLQCRRIAVAIAGAAAGGADELGLLDVLNLFGRRSATHAGHRAFAALLVRGIEDAARARRHVAILQSSSTDELADKPAVSEELQPDPVLLQ